MPVATPTAFMVSEPFEEIKKHYPKSVTAGHASFKGEYELIFKTFAHGNMKVKCRYDRCEAVSYTHLTLPTTERV